MAVLHSLEQQFYGPDSPLPAIAKVSLYIRHRALRDWTTRKQIPKSEIIEATGVEGTVLKRALRNLEKDKFILVTRIKVGKVWSDNVYELHPERFGNDYIYRPEKPSFRVIYGSKHKSNPPKDLSTAPSELSTTAENNDELGPNSALGAGSNSALEVGPQSALGREPKNAELLANLPPKNLLKNPLKELFPKSMNFSEKDFEKEKQRQLREARAAGIL